MARDCPALHVIDGFIPISSKLYHGTQVTASDAKKTKVVNVSKNSSLISSVRTAGRSFVLMSVVDS